MDKKRTTEKYLLLKALQLVADNPGCNTTFIREEIQNSGIFSEEDLELSKTRKGEPLSAQIIRNLTGSHNNNDFNKCTDKTKNESGKFNFYINKLGLETLGLDKQESFDYINDEREVNEVINQQSNKEVGDVTEKNNRVPKKKDTNSKSNRYETDKDISLKALQLVDFKCEYASLMNETHLTFECRAANKTNKQYLEAHHLIPMKAQVDYLPINIDRLENVVGLCPICHTAIHYGTKEEVMKIITPLYNARIDSLNKIGIFITLDELVSKYYL